MGTSKSAPTPSGGYWQPLKAELTNAINSGNAVDPDRVVQQAINGFGGLAPSTRTAQSGGGASSGGAAGGTTGGGGIGRSGGSRARVGGAVASLAGFGSAVGTGGLAAGLGVLGLEELAGKSAAEVVGRVADHIASSGAGQQRELLRDALQGAILEAAQAAGGSYADLENGLQAFLGEQGVEGLVQLFLTEFAANLVWYGIENHVDIKSESVDQAASIRSAVHVACGNKVRDLIRGEKATGRFDSIDWFGEAGRTRGQGIATNLERELRGGNAQ